MTIPGTAIIRNTTTWRKVRHKLSLLVSERENSNFTGFLRLPTQFQALAGPALSHVLGRRANRGPLKVTVLGCSNGAEAYTIASVLRSARRDVPIDVCGYDIDGDCVRHATRARYGPDEIYNNKVITAGFVESTFDRDGASYVIKPHIASCVRFAVGDVLDYELAAGPAAASDIVFAQNFLFHLTPKQAWRALENILRMARTGAALFIDGTDVDLRQRFARRQRLVPLEYEIQQIHEEARRARAAGWPYSYWGLEPFLTYRRDWQRRYATIFLVL